MTIINIVHPGDCSIGNFMAVFQLLFLKYPRGRIDVLNGKIAYKIPDKVDLEKVTEHCTYIQNNTKQILFSIDYTPE